MYKSSSKRFRHIKIFLFGIIFLFLKSLTIIGANYDIVVAKDGSGMFTSISQAIESLPMYNYERVIIYIKNGLYHEKIRIECDYVTLVGESRDSTIIEYNSLRTAWLANPDFLGPAVVNIHADDIILKNITIRNTQPEIGPHAFAIFGTGTRTILINCAAISKGGDTVSLWNYKQGMYYHANCYFEGAVDMVCPRGWCYIRDSKFYELKETAALWHAAVINQNQKLVVENCSIDGVKGFNLARHHYEAQFFFMNCTFSDNMSDNPIEYVVPKDTNGIVRPYFMGDRNYFFNCKKKESKSNWFTNNLNQWPDNIKPSELDAFRTFDYQWNPESDSALQIVRYEFKGTQLFLYFNEIVAVRGNTFIKTHTGKKLDYIIGSGRNILLFQSESPIETADYKGSKAILYLKGEIYSVKASVEEKKMPSTILLSKVLLAPILPEKKYSKNSQVEKKALTSVCVHGA